MKVRVHIIHSLSYGFCGSGPEHSETTSCISCWLYLGRFWTIQNHLRKDSLSNFQPVIHWLRKDTVFHHLCIKLADFFFNLSVIFAFLLSTQETFRPIQLVIVRTEHFKLRESEIRKENKKIKIL